MEIHHKIKPPHGWREFLFEIGVIVLGVLLALGAEQGVEAMHRAHQVEEAENALRLELAEDNGPQAYVRAAGAYCLATQLHAMHAALDAGADRKVFHDMAQAYSPPFRTWDDQAWTSVAASNVGGYMGARRLIAWSTPYRIVRSMQGSAASEAHDVIELKSGRASPGKLSDAETDHFLFVVDRVTRENLELAILSLGLMDNMEKAGAKLAPATQRSLLKDARTRFGDCVRTPDLTLWRSITEASDPKTLTERF